MPRARGHPIAQEPSKLWGKTISFLEFVLSQNINWIWEKKIKITQACKISKKKKKSTTLSKDTIGECILPKPESKPKKRRWCYPKRGTGNSWEDSEGNPRIIDTQEVERTEGSRRIFPWKNRIEMMLSGSHYGKQYGGSSKN